MGSQVLIVERAILPHTKVIGRGRKKGDGDNMRLLAKLQPGQSIWEVPYKKMQAIRASAYRGGFKIKVRRQPHNEHYAIWKLS